MKQTPLETCCSDLIFARFGKVKTFGNRRQLLCDFDRRRAPTLRRLFALCHTLQIAPRSIRLDRTARGWHMLVELPRAFEPAALVAMQAILGSDHRRERLNLMRVLSRNRSRFARRRWNILFESKV